MRVLFFLNKIKSFTFSFYLKTLSSVTNVRDKPCEKASFVGKLQQADNAAGSEIYPCLFIMITTVFSFFYSFLTLVTKEVQTRMSSMLINWKGWTDPTQHIHAHDAIIKTNLRSFLLFFLIQIIITKIRHLYFVDLTPPREVSENKTELHQIMHI